jgi:hypothetical protein
VGLSFAGPTNYAEFSLIAFAWCFNYCFALRDLIANHFG